MAVTITDDFSNKQFYFTFFNSFEDFRQKGQSAYNEIKAKEPDFFYRWDTSSVDSDFVESDESFSLLLTWVDLLKSQDLKSLMIQEVFLTLV
jgi:hypothetical protein